MKNTFFLAIIALFIGVSVSAQSTVDSIAAKYKLLPMPAPLTLEKKFPVIGAYALTTDAAETSTTNTTASTSASTTQTDSTTMTTTTVAAEPSVTITLDSVNKGIVWVEGLPEGKFKAYLKKSPTTYRILAQKTNLGKQIPEGTLYYDVETNALNIAIGGGYNEEDPIGVFAANTNSSVATANTTTSTDVAVAKPKASKTKSKSKVSFYTASKVITEPAAEAQGGGTTQDQQ